MNTIEQPTKTTILSDMFRMLAFLSLPVACAIGLRFESMLYSMLFAVAYICPLMFAIAALICNDNLTDFAEGCNEIFPQMVLIAYVALILCEPVTGMSIDYKYVIASFLTWFLASFLITRDFKLCLRLIGSALLFVISLAVLKFFWDKNKKQS